MRYIDGNTVYVEPETVSRPVRHALEMIYRDHEKVFGLKPSSEREDNSRQMSLHHEKDSRITCIRVRYAANEVECPDWPEAYVVMLGQDRFLHIVGRDDLGLVYGLLHYSRVFLGVDPLWFWAELSPAKRDRIEIADVPYVSIPPAVTYRGWFVNDEVCLIGWKTEYPPTAEVWQPVFETLLRLGGNMVIPGTDLPRTGIHHRLALDMGLYVTHHHAEPLGAEMFLRAFPGKAASYKEHPALFERLWMEAIERQKDERIVWVLSFRGQGDRPFWENDPEFDTPAKRGQLISSVIEKQYNMVKARVEQPVCCMALYGKLAELYKEGYIQLPEEIIKIWADNGYGKMVSRRHGNLNLRIPAFPGSHEGGKHGLYYHVTFHDLQASNHLTMFPSPVELIKQELTKAFKAGAKDYLLVNSGNILPHLHALDFTAEMWRNGDADTQRHLAGFIKRTYGEERPNIIKLYEDYAACTIPYGAREDERAGEEFYHHPARQIIGHWLQGQTCTHEQLIWATGDISFAEQVRWFQSRAEQAIPGWEVLQQRGRTAAQKLSDENSRRLYIQMLVQIELHLTGCRGLASICHAYADYCSGAYPQAFIQAARAVLHYSQGLEALRATESGQWEHFYRADWLTNISNTVHHASTLRSFLRIHGDSPDMFLWYKEYLMPETEKHIYLENTHRNPLPDDRLAELLEERLVELGVLDSGRLV